MKIVVLTMTSLYVSSDQDLGSRVCPHSGGACQGRDLCKAYKARETDAKWYQPSSLDELFGVIGSNPGCRVKLFAGDTGKGIS